MSRFVVGTAAVLLALAVGGCGSDAANPSSPTSGSNPPSSGAASDEAVAWADKVCKSVESEFGTLTNQPNIDTSDPEAAKTGLVQFLDDFGTALDRLIGGIKGAGEPPVPEGKQPVEETTKGLEQAKRSVEDAKTRLSQTPTNDPAALKQAFTDVGQQLTEVGDLDTTDSMENVPQLKDAFDKAETCRKLDQQKHKTSSSAPTS
jgi:hypothetical protein